MDFIHFNYKQCDIYDCSLSKWNIGPYFQSLLIRNEIKFHFDIMHRKWNKTFNGLKKMSFYLAKLDGTLEDHVLETIAPQNLHFIHEYHEQNDFEIGSIHRLLDARFGMSPKCQVVISPYYNPDTDEITPGSRVDTEFRDYGLNQPVQFRFLSDLNPRKLKIEFWRINPRSGEYELHGDRILTLDEEGVKGIIVHNNIILSRPNKLVLEIYQSGQDQPSLFP